MSLASYTGEAANGGRTKRLQFHRGAIKRQLDAILGVRTRGCTSEGDHAPVRANGAGWTPCLSRCTPGGQAPVRGADGEAIAGVVNFTETFFRDPRNGNIYRAAIWAANRDAVSYVGTLVRVS